jgi:hypothetical protein
MHTHMYLVTMHSDEEDLYSNTCKMKTYNIHVFHCRASWTMKFTHTHTHTHTHTCKHIQYTYFSSQGILDNEFSIIYICIYI